MLCKHSDPTPRDAIRRVVVVAFQQQNTNNPGGLIEVNCLIYLTVCGVKLGKGGGEEGVMSVKIAQTPDDREEFTIQKKMLYSLIICLDSCLVSFV